MCEWLCCSCCFTKSVYECLYERLVMHQMSGVLYSLSVGTYEKNQQKCVGNTKMRRTHTHYTEPKTKYKHLTIIFGKTYLNQIDSIRI